MILPYNGILWWCPKSEAALQVRTWKDVHCGEPGLKCRKGKVKGALCMLLFQFIYTIKIYNHIHWENTWMSIKEAVFISGVAGAFTVSWHTLATVITGMYYFYYQR